MVSPLVLWDPEQETVFIKSLSLRGLEAKQSKVLSPDHPFLQPAPSSPLSKMFFLSFHLQKTKKLLVVCVCIHVGVYVLEHRYCLLQEKINLNVQLFRESFVIEIPVNRRTRMICYLYISWLLLLPRNLLCHYL